MEETVRYNYRLRVGAQAERALLAEWNRCRWVWNECIHQFKSGQKPTWKTLGKLLTEARSKFEWLRDGAQEPQSQILRAYAKALTHSFTVKGRGRPQVKKKRVARPTLEYSGNKYDIRNGRLWLVKIGLITVVWDKRDFPKPSSVRVYQDNLGHWYASFVVRRERKVLPETTGEIGVDWGVITTATTTNSEYDLPYLGHRKRVASKYAAQQRKISRKRKPKGQTQSKNYYRAKRAAAKTAKKVARQNVHDGRVWSQKVVRNHQVIAVEDFKVKFLTKTRMARKVADATIATVKNTLIEYGKRAGREVILVNPAYTTMTCSECLTRNKRLPLHVRTFTCPHCGYTDNRDRNAAKVILATAKLDRADVEVVNLENLREKQYTESENRALLSGN